MGERITYDEDETITVEGFIPEEPKTPCCATLQTKLFYYILGIVTGWITAEYVKIASPF